MKNYANNIPIEKTYDWKFELGIALSIMGLPLGWCMGEIFEISSGPFVDTFILVAFLLSLDYKRLLNADKLQLNKLSWFFLSYILVIMIYIIKSDVGNIRQELIYNGYTIAMILAIGTQNKNKKFKNIIKYFSFLGGIVALVTFIYATKFMTNFDFGIRFYLSDSGDPLTLSDRLVVTIIALLLIKSKNKLGIALKYIFIVIAIIGLIATGVRKSIIILIISYLLYLYFFVKRSNEFRFNLKKISSTILKLIISFFLVGTIISTYSDLKNGIERLFDSVIKGIYTYSGSNLHGSDISASVRVGNRDYVITRLLNEDGLLDILLGHGYKDFYVDIPILQAFTDTGVILWIIYLIYSIIVPIGIILKLKKPISNESVFFVLMLVPMLVGQFVNGVPYSYRLWLPLVFNLCFVHNQSKALVLHKIS
jgi:hypothetical protein